MLKLAITFLCIYSASAKFRFYPGYEGFFDEDNEMVPKYPAFHKKEVFASSTGSGDLWALKLDNDLDSVKLRRANARQEQDFDDVVPKQVFLQRLSQPSVKSDRSNDSRLTQDEVSALKEEIMRTINKFVMSIRHEPSSYLADTIQVEDSPTLQLYFHKDRRTLMVVSSKRRQWFYPFAPPTRFPDWLYQTHANAVQESDELCVRIPFDVKEQLYKTLKFMLDDMLAVQ